MVERRLHYRHLTVVGLHGTGPWSSCSYPGSVLGLVRPTKRGVSCLEVNGSGCITPRRKNWSSCSYPGSVLGLVRPTKRGESCLEVNGSGCITPRRKNWSSCSYPGSVLGLVRPTKRGESCLEVNGRVPGQNGVPQA